MLPALARGPNGEPVDSQVAVERIVKIFKETRTSPSTTGQREPVGVVVTVDLELTGLRGRPVLLSWSMWQHSGATRLHAEWLNTNLAYRIEATSDHETASLDL